MESSNYMGLMAVMAASGSVVLVALQAHRRLVSDFRKKLEVELGGVGRGEGKMMMMMEVGEACRRCGDRKKKVRFADDVVEPSSDNKEYRRRHSIAMANRIRAI